MVHELIQLSFGPQLKHIFFDTAMAAANYALDRPFTHFDYQHRQWDEPALIECWVEDRRHRA